MTTTRARRLVRVVALVTWECTVTVLCYGAILYVLGRLSKLWG